jgi:hypothetical protein
LNKQEKVFKKANSYDEKKVAIKRQASKRRERVANRKDDQWVSIGDHD